MTNSLNRRSVQLLAAFAILLTAVALSGCGQKGPLYLPGNPSEIKTEISKQESKQEIPTSEPQDEDDEEDSAEQPE